MEPGATQEPEASAAASRFRNPAADPDSSPSKQSELKLNVGIGIIGSVLSLFVTLLFFFIEQVLALGVLFALITLASVALTARFYGRLKRGRAAASS